MPKSKACWLIFTLAGAVSVRLRQPVLIAYIVVGIALGSAGFGTMMRCGLVLNLVCIAAITAVTTLVLA